MTRKEATPWLLLATAVAVGAFLFVRSQGQVRKEALRADSAEVARDTMQKVFGAFVKRVLQLEITADKIDKALNVKPVIVFSPTITVKPAEGAVTAPVTADSADSVRHAVFPVDSAPIHGSVSVDLPKAPARGRMSYKLGIDPISPRFRVGCALDAGAGGVRRAFLTLDTASVPSGTKIGLGSPQADPEVCSPAPGFGIRLNAPTLAVIGGSVLAGLVAGLLLHP